MSQSFCSRAFMPNYSRPILRLLMIAALAAGPAAGAGAASVKVPTKVKVSKPLVLSVKQDLDFGHIVLASTTGTRIVSISTAGVFSCGVGLTCSGAPRQAIFNLTGSNNQLIRITAVGSPLVNGTGGIIAFTPIAPATITLPNSGSGGLDFGVGGSISLPSTTADGIYAGTVEVTVDYQ